MIILGRGNLARLPSPTEVNPLNMPSWKIIATPVNGAVCVEIDADSPEDYQAAYAAWLRLASSALDDPVADSFIVDALLLNGRTITGTYTLRELAAFLVDSVSERDALLEGDDSTVSAGSASRDLSL